MRPETLDDVVGQEDLSRPGSWFSNLIHEGRAISCVFWGPPGVGKTTLARLMAQAADMPFEQLSAVAAGKAEIQAIVRRARSENRAYLLFLDEIHRFNKAQQDVLLPYIEDGTLILVGATTENPSFSLNNALLSRCRVVVLKPLTPSAIQEILVRAVSILRHEAPDFALDDEAVAWLAEMADGDARYALNALQALFDADSGREWDQAGLQEQWQRKQARYDRDGEGHYDLISALHKSVRDSDADAACYWLARMLEAGEEPLYLARRMIRMATEDVGLADPRALHLCLDALRMYEILGSPEGEQGLFEAVIYLALAPKSNAAYMAEKSARKSARETQGLDVPLHLRNAPTRLMKDLAYGKGYQYAHDAANAVVEQQHFPDGMSPVRYYHPVERGFERTLAERIGWLAEKKQQMKREGK